MNLKTPLLLCFAALVPAAVRAADDAKPAAAPQYPPVTLHVGDPAPALTVGKWIKGTPIQGFEKGRVYVVEFWATWCGPCKASMPHLSELAAKYAGKATFVGVSISELKGAKDPNADYVSHVQGFVNRAKDMMAYNVAVDTAGYTTGFMRIHWMDAGGQHGIPTAFVVDKDGRIGWIGNPQMGLDEAVGLAIDGRLDAAAVARIGEETKAASARAGELSKALQAAKTAGDNAKVIATADELMKVSPVYALSAIPAKYLALAATDPKAAADYVDSVMASHANDPILLETFGAQVAGAAAPDYRLAIRLYQGALKVLGSDDVGLMSSFANAIFKEGSPDAAASFQRSVVDSMKNSLTAYPAEMIAKAEDTLKTYQAAIPRPTLNVGDPAPALAFAKWIKGTPVQGLEKGKVYVIECWATWCGPCRGSMPHLSALAKKYAGKATFIGMDVWELSHTEKKDAEYIPHVESFVGHAGDMMAYNVAVDTSGGQSGAMATHWLKAAGRNGIPCSFVIDKEGRIAWIGHPMVGLDEAVGLAIEDKLDASGVAQIKAKTEAESKLSQKLSKELERAQDSGDNAAILAAADAMLSQLETSYSNVYVAKYQALAATDPKAARAFADDYIAAHANAPLDLSSLASGILSPDCKHPDYAVALRAMQAAMKCSDPSDAYLSGQLARAYFKTGDAAKAVSLQTTVIDSMKNGLIDYPKDQVSAAEAALKEYQTSSSQASI